MTGDSMADVDGAYLLSLPLHTITEVYGEAGLRRRFALEIARFDQPTQDRLSRALRLADRLHADDRRVREPYLNHLLRVTIRIICYYRIHDSDVLAAALLHDAVEDHPQELAGGVPADPTGAALGVLARDFGPRVAQLVGSVTNHPDHDRDEQYHQHVAESLAADPWARVLKLSDFTDNAVGVVYASGPKVRRAATKYRPLLPVLRDLVQRPDTPLDDQARQHVLDQLDLAEQRFAAILGG